MRIPAAACLLLLFAGAHSLASGARPDSRTWQDFWRSVHVEPAPPRDFLDVEYRGRVDNLTGGRLSDDTARTWVIGALRRSLGDLHASHHLRDDIANAGVFGPPGLNGTGEGIEELRQKGIESIDAPMMVDVIAAAVIAVPEDVRAMEPEAGLTEYVIVLLYRPKRAQAVLVYQDGRREIMVSERDSQPRWQLDTGRFEDHPVLGPLWYQERGWTCRPDDSVVGRLCGLVRP